ncbi:MAG: hypothetical protein F4056_10260 [Chloroflexi bacterium]|nr:hypothetical protein [Chloroflexota bacterium]
MTEQDPNLQRNAEATARLGDLVARLGSADLERSLGGGWTVAFALVHLAFWDARQTAALAGYTSSQALPSPEDETVNPTLEAVAAMFDPAAAGPAAVEAAGAVDAAAAALSAEQRSALREAGQEYAFRRWPHREEHIAQIEAVLP